MESFKTTNNCLFSSYYKKYYSSALDELVIYFIPENDSHIDAFSINGKCIFCDLFLIEKYELTEMECYSCIAHEVGHYIGPSKEVLSDPNQREFYADQNVLDLGLANYLISALTKMCPEDELTKLRIEKLSDTIS